MNAISVDAEITKGLSGGDRILIELAKRWQDGFISEKIITCSSGEKIIKKYLADSNISIETIAIPASYYRHLAWLYLVKIYRGLKYFHQHKLDEGVYLYSSSDFWPDSLPAFYAKFKNPKIKWLAGFYLFAPTPWQKDSPYRTNIRLWFRGLLFWLTQLPAYYLIKKYADVVLVTSEPDVKKFVTKKRDRSKIIVVQGGVDITESEKYLNYPTGIIPWENRKYAACFVGRFHYQKGVLELIDIWRKVVENKPIARLAMIGVGPLEPEIKQKIKEYHLENNIELLGFKDGPEKYEIFKQSKIMVHPATYDSGGMAAAEGMAWGLPGVSFDLEALKTYYPRGMVKTAVGDISQFAKNIERLLDDKAFYSQTSGEARRLIVEIWDWDKRAKAIYNLIFN